MGTKSDPVLIRDAVADDIPAMVELLAQLFSIEQDFVPDAEKQGRGLALLLGQPGAHVLVAEREGRVVGMISVQTLVSTAEGGPVGLVEDLVVGEGHRGEGIGGRLLQGMEACAREMGLSRLQLLADMDNTSALDFYTRRGWRRTSLMALRWNS
ncbi:GNAT family N-acetyltransferase [Thioalkalivibrio sulfidiphilus]|uniref:GNAT family N-acetyltransferase n=1 Tax=Thioalkalivibrio sulfidiphilus TaxID=1033854 RepID=UPI00036A8507|nr:GNAT family N-acetyltransferase [Thioalkalivibrio sulfidiphilus]